MKTLKIGDWVTITWHKNSEPHKITCIWEGDSTDNADSTEDERSSIFFDTCADRLAHECIPWFPEEYDFCWFTNLIDYYAPVFGQFIDLRPDGYLVLLVDGKGGVTYDEFTYCIPFTGELPDLCKSI